MMVGKLAELLETFGEHYRRIKSRKKGNDHESIQLPNTFRPRHQREKRMHLKQRHQEALKD